MYYSSLGLILCGRWCSWPPVWCAGNVGRATSTRGKELGKERETECIATEKPGNRMAPGLVLFLYSVSLIIPYSPVFCVVHSGMSHKKSVKILALYSHFHKLKFENPLPACV